MGIQIGHLLQVKKKTKTKPQTRQISQTLIEQRIPGEWGGPQNINEFEKLPATWSGSIHA